MTNKEPIQFIHQEIIDVIMQIHTRLLTEDALQTVIDLASENIIEHFNLNNR